MVDCETNSSKCEDYLKYYVSDEAKIKVISQRPDLVSKATFQESWKVRQAISQYVTKIPLELKSEYESLLTDDSYVTIESALYNLWVNFPTERSKYLFKTTKINTPELSLSIIMLCEALLDQLSICERIVPHSSLSCGRSSFDRNSGINYF